MIEFRGQCAFVQFQVMGYGGAHVYGGVPGGVCSYCVDCVSGFVAVCDVFVVVGGRLCCPVCICVVSCFVKTIVDCDVNSVCGCGGGHGRVGVNGSEYVICGTVFVLGNGHGCVVM